MSLTLEKLRRLREKEFHLLYDGNVAKWVAMVNSGRTYAHTFIGVGEVIRPGDISVIIQNAIRNDAEFLAHAATNGTHQKYWVEWFADYILDRIYPTDAGQ